jgi:3-dehydroquinate synthase
MAYSATLANMRGLLNDQEYHKLLNLFSRAGLSMDHEQFDANILDKATKAILKTRDGKLRAAVPSPLGSCVFLNDVSMDEMYAALRKHKEVVKKFPRNGAGLEAYVDASDTGYTLNDNHVENVEAHVNGHELNGLAKKVVINDDARNGIVNGNGHLQNGDTNGVSNAVKHAGQTDGVTMPQKQASNGYIDGVSNLVGSVNGRSRN